MSEEKKDLTNSMLHRQNILNNPFALQKIEKATHIQGISFEGRSIVLKDQVASFFEVTPRTVDNYIEKYSDELRRNGYEVLRGNRLKELKKVISNLGGNEIDFVTKTTVLGIFDFRAFLNLAMLMVESERARLLRQSILQRAFEGKLVPQDENDEPALLLLERIRTERAKIVPRRGRRRKGGVHRAIALKHPEFYYVFSYCCASSPNGCVGDPPLTYGFPMKLSEMTTLLVYCQIITRFLMRLPWGCP